MMNFNSIFLAFMMTTIVAMSFLSGTLQRIEKNMFDFIGLYIIGVTVCLFLFYIAIDAILNTKGKG